MAWNLGGLFCFSYSISAVSEAITQTWAQLSTSQVCYHIRQKDVTLAACANDGSVTLLSLGSGEPVADSENRTV